jgi:hypothetical protein
MLWPINDHCNDRYDKCFSTPKNIKIIYDNINQYTINYEAYDCVDNYNSKNIFYFYKDLNLVESLKKDIVDLKNRNGIKSYNAVHIRRTDHSSLAQKNCKYTHDEIFEKFICDSPLPVYLATDNFDTQQSFKQKYKDKIFVYKNIDKISTTYRKTSLTHSAIDIWMCIFSNNFIPSGYSSFSDLIIDKRKELYA